MFGPEYRWCSVFPETETVPRERLALIEFCRRRANYLTFDERDIHVAIGRMVATGQQVDSELRQLFTIRFIRDRWLSMVGVVQAADYENVGHQIILDFIAQDWTELAKDYVGQAMEKSVPTSRMAPAEEDRLIAKLTEGTEKIGCRSTIVVPGEIETIEFHVLTPSRLHRLAFAKHCKDSLRICDAVVGNQVIISYVHADSFGDPGSTIQGLISLYPGLPMRVRIKNVTSEPVPTDAWIGCYRIATGAPFMLNQR